MKKNGQKSWQLRPGERRLLITFGDFLFAWVAFGIAVYVWAIAQLQDRPLMEFVEARLQPWFFLLPILWVVLLIDSYDGRISLDFRKTVRSVTLSAAIGTGIYLAVFFVSDQTLPRPHFWALLMYSRLPGG